MARSYYAVNLQQMVAFLQRDWKFPLSILLQPIANLQHPESSVNEPLEYFVVSNISIVQHCYFQLVCTIFVIAPIQRL